MMVKTSEETFSGRFNNIFKGEKISNITPFLGIDLFFKSAPLYKSSIDYTEENKILRSELHSNLKTLKNECTEKNWLESVTQNLTFKL